MTKPASSIAFAGDKGREMRNFMLRAQLIAFILAIIASQRDPGNCGHDQTRQ
jgi:hypothetical protein